MSELVWQCCRIRAGPLTKECRAIRPRYTRVVTAQDRRAVADLKRCACMRSPVDRIELMLALLGKDARHYTLSFADENLPTSFDGVRRALKAFLKKLRRWRYLVPLDYVYVIEGLHGDHRYHIHFCTSPRQIADEEIAHLWCEGHVYAESVLRKDGGFRRLAEYFHKEKQDGFVIPINRHPWACSRSLSAKLQPPERWEDPCGIVTIPAGAIWSRTDDRSTDYGLFCYAAWII